MTYFADRATSVETSIVENEWIAKDTMRVRVRVPEMAAAVVPGQFFMVRNPAGNDPLIGRALALYDVARDDGGWIDLVYLVKGKLTTSLSKLQPGHALSVWGPLGNGFDPVSTDHLIMVAGGIGQTPFLALAREALGRQQFGLAGEHQRSGGYAKHVSFCYGVRNAAYLAGLDQFREAGCSIHIASEDGTQPDGSSGRKERVTDTLSRVLDENAHPNVRIVCCGPEPMMEAVAEIASRRKLPCQVSLETPMACGIGVCFTCVAKIKDEVPDPHAPGWDYKRTCVEGPVFCADQIVWD